MRYFRRSLLLAGLAIWLASLCSAGPVYSVDIDTSPYIGTNGAIYFQVDSGSNADPATAIIPTFAIGSPGALSGIPSFSTGVTGALDDLPLSIPNSEPWNYYQHSLSYGNWITFRVTFALPDPLTGDSGSTFSFGLTASDGISPILTQDPSGFIGQIGYDNQGAFSSIQLSPAGTITNLVPEPGTLALLGLGLAACALRRILLFD